jgi:hypothetical protein
MTEDADGIHGTKYRRYFRDDTERRDTTDLDGIAITDQEDTKQYDTTA